MTSSAHDIDVVTSRWARRNSEQRWRMALFAEFQVAEMVPGSLVYQRLTMAIALQQVFHGLRPILRHIGRWLP